MQQNGYIKIVGGGTFLDIHTKVACCGEQGLLGLAFRPDYNELCRGGLPRLRLFHAASDGAIVLAEYRRSTGNANAADPNSFRRLLVIPHMATQTTTGLARFREDSRLYMPTGDGGGGGDDPPATPRTRAACWARCSLNPLPSADAARIRSPIGTRSSA